MPRPVFQFFLHVFQKSSQNFSIMALYLFWWIFHQISYRFLLLSVQSSFLKYIFKLVVHCEYLFFLNICLMYNNFSLIGHYTLGELLLHYTIISSSVALCTYCSLCLYRLLLMLPHLAHKPLTFPWVWDQQLFAKKYFPTFLICSLLFALRSIS